jgi:hypothetical protein
MGESLFSHKQLSKFEEKVSDQRPTSPNSRHNPVAAILGIARWP